MIKEGWLTVEALRVLARVEAFTGWLDAATGAMGSIAVLSRMREGSRSGRADAAKKGVERGGVGAPDAVRALVRVVAVISARTRGDVRV